MSSFGMGEGIRNQFVWLVSLIDSFVWHWFEEKDPWFLGHAESADVSFRDEVVLAIEEADHFGLKLPSTVNGFEASLESGWWAGGEGEGSGKEARKKRREGGRKRWRKGGKFNIAVI